MSTIKLHALPQPIREVLDRAERSAHLTYANAINHSSPAYDVEAQRAHEHYTYLCEEVMVCYAYGCYERTDLAEYCTEHQKGHTYE